MEGIKCPFFTSITISCNSFKSDIIQISNILEVYNVIKISGIILQTDAFLTAKKNV